MYREGQRCPEVVSAIHTHQNNTTPRYWTLKAGCLARIAACMFNLWESDANGEPSRSLKSTTTANSRRTEQVSVEERLRKFSNFLGSFLERIEAHPLTVMIAALLVDRLRRAHPQARGEPGCSHRLAIVSLMLSTRYYQANNSDNSLNGHNSRSINNGQMTTEMWAAMSGIFSPAELAKMETEFAAFLGWDLYIGMPELSFWVKNALMAGNTTNDSTALDGRIRRRKTKRLVNSSWWGTYCESRQNNGTSSSISTSSSSTILLLNSSPSKAFTSSSSVVSSPFGRRSSSRPEF